MSKQISIRLRDEDEELARRLAAFSQRGAQGDLVRFALWAVLMPDSDLPASVAAAAEHFELASRDPVERSPVVQQLADIADRLTDMMQRPAQPAVGELVSDGLDMTSRRRPARPQPADSKKAGPGTAH